MLLHMREGTGSREGSSLGRRAQHPLLTGTLTNQTGSSWGGGSHHRIVIIIVIAIVIIITIIIIFPLDGVDGKLCKGVVGSCLLNLTNRPQPGRSFKFNTYIQGASSYF